MKVPLSWLTEYLTLDLTPEQIADALTLGGMEVDKIDQKELGFSGIVVAKVIKASPHPNADKLRVATVWDGKEEFQVVCGASNCREGLKTAFARVGAKLKDEKGTFTIKKAKLRDVESFGMLCSEKELGLAEESEGIIELPQDLPEGTDLATLYGDTVFEISLTPNLGHCLSILGVARELGAILNQKVRKHPVHVTEDPHSSIASYIKVSIEDRERCSRYTCRVVKNITVGPSPLWMQKRLQECGVRSINNVVDISNYVMLEVGQPLHFFDYDEVDGKEIIVRSKTDATSLVTLDEVERKIPPETLLICDAKKPLAFAGIMGGASSAVSDKTKIVLIESAHFTSVAIRRSCKLLSMRTDGSHRWERGVDPDGVLYALDMAAAMLQKLAGGEIVQGFLDIKTHPVERKKIHCRTSRVNQMLGTHLSTNEIGGIFERLDMIVQSDSLDSLTVSVPTYRNDVLKEIDLVDEVGRIYGFNHIPKPPPRFSSSSLPHAPIYLLEKQTRTQLIALGLQEILTCDLISPYLADLTEEKNLKSEDALIRVLQPKSVDQSVLRLSLLPGALQVMQYNWNHQNYAAAVFEVGKIHFRDRGSVKEQMAAAITLMGFREPYHWNPKPSAFDFFDLKGYVTNFLEGMGYPAPVFESSHMHNFHPGRQASIKIQDVVVGVMGEVLPSHLKKLDIGERVYFAELNLHDLFPFNRKKIQVDELSLYFGSERDWTITLKDETPIEEILSIIHSVKSPLLEKIQLLDLYKSEQIGKDRKNATFRFLYRDREKTIDMESVEKEHAKIIQKVVDQLQNLIR